MNWQLVISNWQLATGNWQLAIHRSTKEAARIPDQLPKGTNASPILGAFGTGITIDRRLVKSPSAQKPAWATMSWP
jgi:hypothetical protein